MRYTVSMTNQFGYVTYIYEGADEGEAKVAVYDAIFTAFPGEGHITVVAEQDVENPGSADFFAYRGIEAINVAFNAFRK